jgi:hypothetical protein
MPNEPRSDASGLHFSAFHPTSNETSILITRRKLLQRAKLGEWMLHELTVTVQEILSNPAVIFEGIRKEDDECKGPDGAGWWCYAGVPSTRFVDDAVGVRKPKPTEVFLIFVTENHVAYSFRWEGVASSADWLRSDHEERFRKAIYRKKT